KLHPIALRLRKQYLVTLDPEIADAYGVHAGRIDNLFALILAATVVSPMQVLGVTLLAAALVVPAVVARLVNDSFGKMLVLSGVVGALCGLVGMYVSFHVNVASGATIVLVAASLFIVVFAITAIAARRRLQVLTPAQATSATLDLD